MASCCQQMILLTIFLLHITTIADENYFGIVYDADPTKPNNYEANAINFTDNHTIYIGNFFNDIKRSDGCYQTASTYFWTFYGTDFFSNISVTTVYTIDLAGNQYQFVSFPNKTINYYCLQLIDFPAGAVTVSYNPLNKYKMDIFWVFESPIEHRAKPYKIPVNDEFIANNYSIITGMVQSVGQLIIFYTNTSTPNYKYAMYNINLQQMSAYGDAKCQFGNGVIDTFFVYLQFYSYFITIDNGDWYIGQLKYDQDSYNVTGCSKLCKFDAIPGSDEYYSGDINGNGTEIVVSTSSGVYHLDLAAAISTKIDLPNIVNTTLLGSINFAIDIE